MSKIIEWGEDYPVYLEKIHKILPTLSKPDRAEFYRVVTVVEKLVSISGPDQWKENGVYQWHFDGLIVSLGSCDEPTPDFLEIKEDIKNLKPRLYGENRRNILKVPIWFWCGKWEIVDKEISGYRKEYGFEN